MLQIANIANFFVSIISLCMRLNNALWRQINRKMEKKTHRTKRRHSIFRLLILFSFVLWCKITYNFVCAETDCTYALTLSVTTCNILRNSRRSIECKERRTYSTKCSACVNRSKTETCKKKIDYYQFATLNVQDSKYK